MQSERKTFMNPKLLWEVIKHVKIEPMISSLVN